LLLKIFHLLMVATLWITLTTAHAQSILDSAQYLFFEPGDNTRLSVDIGFKNISVDKSAEIVAQTLGGKIEKRNTVDYILQEIKCKAFTAVSDLV